MQAARAALAAAGYRTQKEGQHYLALQSLAFTIGLTPDIVKRLDKFRQKRNISDYEQAGLVTEQEADEMVSLAREVREQVEQWIRKDHPELVQKR